MSRSYLLPWFQDSMAHADMFVPQGLQDDQRVGCWTLEPRLRGFKQQRATMVTIYRDAQQR